MVATGVPILKSLVWLDLEKSQPKQESNPGSSALEMGTLTTRSTRRSRTRDWYTWLVALWYQLWVCDNNYVQWVCFVCCDNMCSRYALCFVTMCAVGMICVLWQSVHLVWLVYCENMCSGYDLCVVTICAMGMIWQYVQWVWFVCCDNMCSQYDWILCVVTICAVGMIEFCVLWQYVYDLCVDSKCLSCLLAMWLISKPQKSCSTLSRLNWRNLTTMRWSRHRSLSSRSNCFASEWSVCVFW